MARTFTTSQVIRHLERQPELVFEAPEMGSEGWHYRRARSCVSHSFIEDRDGDDAAVPHRSDWTLVSGTIREPRRRVKLGTIDLGDITVGTPDLTLPRTVALSDDICEALRRTGKRWMLVAVEVEGT